MSKLDAFECDLIVGLLQESYIEHTSIAKLQFLEGKITKERLDWDYAHAKYIQETKTKLIKLLNANLA